MAVRDHRLLPGPVMGGLEAGYPQGLIQFPRQGGENRFTVLCVSLSCVLVR